MEITSNIATAAATKSPKAALSILPEVINFYHTGKGSYLGKFVWFYTIQMEQKTKTIPFCTIWKKYWFRTKIRKKLNDVISFNNSITTLKKWLCTSKTKTMNQKRDEKYKTLNTILESLDTIVIIGATSTSITLSITAIGLIILPISDGIACTLSLDYKVLHKLIMSKYTEYKKRYERDQQTIQSFDKLYRKSSQDNVIDKTEYEGLCNIFTKYLEETKNESFLKDLLSTASENLFYAALLSINQPVIKYTSNPE